MPSYLYSIAHSPPIFDTTSPIEGRRSASMTFIGLPMVTCILCMPSIPLLQMVSATNPRSHVTLNALSTDSLSSFVANAIDKASKIVIVDAPILILPVTILQRYLASNGPESWSRLARCFIFLSCESFPSAVSMSVKPFTTLSNVKGSENNVICFFVPISFSATAPGSPSFTHISSTLLSLVPDVNAIALNTSLSAIPSSTP